MFKYTIVFLLLLTVILFPIPLKITLKYINKVLEIYIYNKRFMVKKPLKNKTEKTFKNTSKKNSKESFLRSLILSDIRLIFYKIKNLKFKPVLVLNAKLEYGLDDAALVAILFGLIHSTYSLLHLILINFVKVKDMDIQVIPHYEKYDLNMEISSIIYINLAKVIYIAFVMIFCLIKIKNTKISIKNYKGGDIYG